VQIPIAKIGELQRLDLEQSSGIVYYDDFARVCTVGKFDRGIGDQSPHRMSKLFGGDWQYYNNQFIIQVAGCPLDCSYCYVDNLRPDALVNARFLVGKFQEFRIAVFEQFGEFLNVFHFMGGAPAVYCEFWPELREELYRQSLGEVILFSNAVLVEGLTHQVSPWHYMGTPQLIVEGCLKGSNRENFKQNTGRDLFNQATLELVKYLPYKNFYLTLIGYDEKDLPQIYSWIGQSRVDLLKVVNYEATKAKRSNCESITS